MNKPRHIILNIACLALMWCGALTSCSDEPDAEHFYTFTGEMASDYLRNREDFSEFTEIVDRAGLMDLLSTYGHYTCFVPTNEAMNEYFKSKGIPSVSALSDADCDTIARTHLVNNMYTTSEMTQDRLATANMMGRYIATSSTFDAEDNAVILLEGIARIMFKTQDDSVENGMMQPIDHVIEKSNNYVSDLVRDNPKLSTFYKAMVETGVVNEIMKVDDPNYDNRAYPKYYYKSHTWSEVGWVPDTKKYGYTIFVEPDDVLESKYNIPKGDMRALYDLACSIYDPVYPEDVAKEGHDFNHLTDSINPLHRFVQYHILTRYAAGTADLTPMELNNWHGGSLQCAIGFDEKLINPSDWFHTLLPHTLIKVEKATVPNYLADAKKGDKFINRRYDATYKFRGSLIDPSTDADYIHDGINGHYFYVDDLVVFSYDVQNKVQNMRIRMDFSSVFPEVMTNGLRFVGTLEDDPNAVADDATVPKNGRNYYFPLGYLDGVTFSNCNVVLRRPHPGFWSWQGDEWNLFGDYDFTFRLPPIPYSGDWQVRLGFCAIETRGVMQVYFDGVPQGIPLDMTKFLNSDLYIGDSFTIDESAGDYDKKTSEEKAEEQKLLKNLGAYRSPRSIYHYGPNALYFVGNERTYRRILCQSYMDATKDHYIRFRVASDGKQGNNNEFMLDYLELVPKSVYGVDGDGQMEDDL